MLKIGMHVFFILCIVLLLVNLVAYTLYGTASEPITFSAFLDKLDEAPQIKLSVNDIADSMKITDDWGAFNFFRNFVNVLSDALAVIVWLCTVLINLITIIGYLGYLFGLSAVSSFI